MRIIAMARESSLNSEIDPIVVMSEMTKVLLLKLAMGEGLQENKGMVGAKYWDSSSSPIVSVLLIVEMSLKLIT